MTTRPQLRPELVIVEQAYRGERTYIVKDPETHRYFRFKPLELLVMQHFDGEHTPQEIADALAAEGLPFKASAVAAFAQKLRTMGLLVRSLKEQSVLVLERQRAERHRRVRGTHYQGSLLRMRWSLTDPDQLFDRWIPRLRFFFTPTFVVLSLALFAMYFVVLGATWPAVPHGVMALYDASTYSLQFILVFWGTAMATIAVHELGHGLTCKHFGGEVHEMGAMLIYFQPAFYCNVNDAWTFPGRRERLWVTAAGSWIQMVIAALAAIVWLVVEPETLVSQIAFSAVLIGGITTVLANANPLIPLDGYYALSDYLEVPNLRQRAFAYLGWLVRRHVLRLEVPEPPADDREKRILVVFGALSLVYIVLILTVVAAWVLGWVDRALGAIGVVAFALLLWALLRDVARSWGHAVVTSVREHRRALTSKRLWGRLGPIFVVVALLGFLVPWPVKVRGGFVADPAARAYRTAPSAAAAFEIRVREGDAVTAGEPLVRLRDLNLELERARRKREADSLAAQLGALRGSGSPGAVRQLDEALAEARARVAALDDRVRALTLRAPIHGVVLTPRIEEQIGRWYEPGDTVALVARTDTLELRIALDGAGAGLVRPEQHVQLMAHADLGWRLRSHVASVATTGDRGDGRVEARVLVAASQTPLRPGATGEAKITVRRTSVFGALWWAVRKRIRNDLLL
jgi:putative peptide zinc metalloprotease protein